MIDQMQTAAKKAKKRLFMFPTQLAKPIGFLIEKITHTQQGGSALWIFSKTPLTKNIGTLGFVLVVKPKKNNESGLQNKRGVGWSSFHSESIFATKIGGWDHVIKDSVGRRNRSWDWRDWGKLINA